MFAHKIGFLRKKTFHNKFADLFWVGVLVSVSSCSHAPTEKGRLRAQIEPRALLAEACRPGQSIQQASGVAWMKAKSPDASGQFPASIQAKAPSSLKLEVQQPFGGTAAVLMIEDRDLRIDVPGKPERSRREQGAWAGIPLRWATDLFLGRIPCPDATSLQQASLAIDSEDELIVSLVADATGKPARFLYRFDRQKDGRYLAKFLRWESGGAAVDFEFGDPESETLSPLKWQAKSKQGEVKIRWRDREIVR